MQALWIIYFLLVAVMGLSLYLSYVHQDLEIRPRACWRSAQNEDAAAVLGVPTPLYKALAYSASAFLPAIAGGLYFFKGAFIQPTDAFDLTFSTEAIVIDHAGRPGHRVGPAIGAYFYEELRGWLLTSDTFANFQLVIAGALLLVIVLFAPGGLMGWLYCALAAPAKGAGMTALLGIENLSKSFGGLAAVHGLSFAVNEREILGLIGPNGAGKSTLFNLINGVFTPDAGRVMFRGIDITGKAPYRVARARARAHAPDRAAARAP